MVIKISRIIILLVIIIISFFFFYKGEMSSLEQIVKGDLTINEIRQLENEVESIVLNESNLVIICEEIDELGVLFENLILTFEFRYYVILEKFRNGSVVYEGTPTTSEYHAVFEESYIQYLVESESESQTDMNNWKYNLEFITKNYDELIAKYQPNKLFKFYIDNYIDVYTNMLSNENY